MSIESLRGTFQNPESCRRPIYYFTLPALDTPDIAELLRAEVAHCRSCGFSSLIPQLPLGTHLEDADLATLATVYQILLCAARELGLTVGFYIDPALEEYVVSRNRTLASKVLVSKDYFCTPEETLERKLHKGDLMSLVAFSEEYYKRVDLRPFIEGDRVVWQVPRGNYILREFLAIDNSEQNTVNMLSYQSSRAFLEEVFIPFRDVFAPYWGTTLNILSYSELGFNAINHRNWERTFNEVFERRFGFDPAPYYPALFTYIGPETDHIKACFMTTRAEMLQTGMLLALYNFAKENDMLLFGTLSEPKLSACSLTAGDALLCNAFSPCALFDKAYMYGTNSLALATGAAYGFDIGHVGAELFRSYTKHDERLLYKDAMNAFGRGVNCTAVHLPDELSHASSFGDFSARVQTLLRGGKHVADIAVIYPIYHLHSTATLYFSPADGYEYPATPPTADYMNLINSIIDYAGHDVTLLHPEVIEKRCRVQDAVLYLDNKKNSEAFRVVVLPSTSMIALSTLRLLKTFFDQGGKVLAAGLLPTKAFEYDEGGENDREVCRLTREIFGAEACDPSIMRDFCYNKNGRGGEAYFLYYNSSSVDGTRMTRSSTVNEALNSFGINFDVFLPAMPRLECTGALNTIFPEYRAIGLHSKFPGGGVLNYVHKRRDDCEIYYFNNTTNEDYNHHVLLRGAFSIEEWNPHNGDMRARTSKLLSYCGEIYTDLRLTLPSCSSLFFLATARPACDEPIEQIDSIKALQSDHAARMSEF